MSIIKSTTTTLSTRGPSSSQTPYIVNVTSNPNLQVTSILTVGDATSTGYQMAGIPDGLGAYDNGDGTFTLLMNHEIAPTLGAVRAHGGRGAFISSWVIRKSDLRVISGADLIQRTFGWDVTNQRSLTTNVALNFSRFCSADLPAVSAFYNAATGRGTQERLFMHGEEGGATGYQLATVATGANRGSAYILGKFNLATNGSGINAVGAWENALANPFAQDKTIVVATNDGGTGIMNNSVAVYVGTKTNTGSEVDRAGLTNGTLKFVNVVGNPVEIVNNTTRATNITNGTRFTLAPLSATTFSRPEDGAWNPLNPREFYFATTDQLDQVRDGVGTQVGRSRLWRLTFDDITNPDAGGRIDLLLDGTEGGNMFDNLAITQDGNILLQEDTGNAAHSAKIWLYNIAADTLTLTAQFDPARFGDIGRAATSPFNIDEESSGIIDMRDIMGPGWFLLAAQAHYTTGIPSNLVEGGQMLAMYEPDLDPNIFRFANTDVFDMPGDDLDGTANIQVNVQLKTKTKAEVGAFLVDDFNGSIDGILPGAQGYDQKVLDRIRAGEGQVLVSTLSDSPTGFNLTSEDLTRIIEVSANQKIRFYSFSGSTTTDDALRGTGTFQFSSVQQVTNLASNSFTVEFADFTLTLSETTQSVQLGTALQGNNEREILSFTGLSGRTINASFSVYREARFDNLIGFYRVDDVTGRVGGLNPGDAGYAQAAMRARVSGIDLSTGNQGTSVFNSQFSGGGIYVPFIITDGGTVDQVLNSQIDRVYFPYIAANVDKVDHIRLLGNNVFGFEDLSSGGDRDFNDLIIKVNLTLA